MASVAATPLFSFADAKPPVDLQALALGPDKAPYVLDAATSSVYRIDLKAGKATPVARAGQVIKGVKVAAPMFIVSAYPDLLILDAKNVLWRWRPADKNGHGTLLRVTVKGASSWGDDILAIGSFVRNREAGLYNLYVIDPSAKQILAYSPAADGGGFPADATGWLAAPQDLTGVKSMLIDGDIYLSRGGSIARYIRGGDSSWKPADPGDTVLRTNPAYSLIATASDKDAGSIYAYDQANRRVIALDKASGSIVAQYRLDGTDPGWSDLRGMYVVLGISDDPATLIWIDKDRLMSSLLQAVEAPNASPSPSASTPPASSSPSPRATPKATKKPAKTPKP